MKEHREKVEAIVSQYEQKYPVGQRREGRDAGRRSENKVRSSMGLGEHPKQYSTEPLGSNSKEKLTISIQNMEDELSIQKQASRIYEKHIQEKEKYYRYEKGREGPPAPRIGIMKSEELRYYL